MDPSRINHNPLFRDTVVSKPDPDAFDEMRDLRNARCASDKICQKWRFELSSVAGQWKRSSDTASRLSWRGCTE